MPKTNKPMTRSGSAVPTRISPLDIVVRRFADAHDDHVSPIVGCYLCLHGVTRGDLRIRAAA